MLKNLKDNKKGFSLVELICAVFILGIVCVPLVRSFVVSSNMSKRAVEISRATLAAQNIIETIDARPISNFSQCSALDSFPQLKDEQKALMKEMFGSDDDVTLTTVTNAAGTKIAEDGSFQLAVQGVKTGSTAYDALVTFSRGDPTNPSSAGVPGSKGIYEINSQDIAEYENMDAVFSQPYTEEANPDIRADVEIRAMMTAQGISPNEKPIKKKRTIDIVTAVEDNDTRDTIKAYIQYTYTYEYAPRSGERKGPNGEATYTYYILPGEYPNKENINVYMMIYPWYSGTYATSGCTISDDSISVYNNVDGSNLDSDIDPVDMTLYVYMQKPYVYVDKSNVTASEDFAHFEVKDASGARVMSGTDISYKYLLLDFGEMLYYQENADGTVSARIDTTAKDNIVLDYYLPEVYDIDDTEDEEADIRTFIYTNGREVGEKNGGTFHYYVSNDIWASGNEEFEKTITGDLVKKKKNKLMYDVKIELYAPDTLVINPEDEVLTIPDEAKPIYSTLCSKSN